MQLILILNTVFLTTGLCSVGSTASGQTTALAMSPLITTYHPVESDATHANVVAKTGVIVMAHGGDAAWNRDVENVVSPLRKTYPIEIAYGMATTSSLQNATKKLEEQGVTDIAVVRMFISGESFLEPTEYILGLRESFEQTPLHRMATAEDLKQAHGSSDHPSSDHPGNHGSHGGGHVMAPSSPITSNATFVLSQKGVSESKHVDDILINRVRSLSLHPESESILILAHGPGDDSENERWLANMNRRIKLLHTIGNFVDIYAETLREDWPSRREAAEKRIRAFVQTNADAGTRVIVIPFRIAGFGPYEEVLEGLNYVSDGRGFTPHPIMTRWIDQTARNLIPSLPKAKLGTHTAH